jgi:endo-1,4-beta-D-glucanase Y
MNRRNFLSGLGITAAFGGQAGAAQAQALLRSTDLSTTAAPVWAAWKEGYLQPDGRVIDRLQQNASHSEGQGYGMVLATEFGDLEAFRRMFDWTEIHLAIRGDPLLAWRFLPDALDRVPDMNNASDGDLFYAWALLRAARRFSDRRFLQRATEIAEALAERCIVQSPAQDGSLLFLPAAFGFTQPESAIINPSYLMPLAMRELSAATGVTALATAALNGEALLQQLASNGPVPDWVAITAAGITPAQGFSADAGYEAMRVPLFLIWSGQTRHLAVAQMMQVYERTVVPGQPVPTKISADGGLVLESSNDPGYRALAALINCAGRIGQVGSDMPPFDRSQPYYPATLQMFAMIAANQIAPECVPI